MKIRCDSCCKKFYRSEDSEYNQNICFKCALCALTADHELDQEPDGLDLENAIWRSGEDPWDYSETLEQEDRRLFPGDFIEHEDEDPFCYRCNHDRCVCLTAEEVAEQDRQDELRVQESKRLEEIDQLYADAVTEDYQRYIDAELEAEEARLKADEEAYREMYKYYSSWRFKLRIILEKIWWWRL